MSEERLSYPDFRNELLFAFAVYVEGDFEHRALATEAAKLAKRFQTSWITAGANWLSENEYLMLRSAQYEEAFAAFDHPLSTVERLQQLGNRNPATPPEYSLTEKGYLEAMKIGRFQGRVLENEMDEFVAAGGPEGLSWDSEFDQDVAIKIDRHSAEFVEVERSVDEALTTLSGNNVLMSDPDGSRRQAELKAAKALLLGDSVNISLFKKIIIPALQWVAAKIGDEAAGMAIQAAIVAVMTWIATKGG